MAANRSSLTRGAVLLPVKGFSDAKARLEPVLSAENRASLAAFTAAGVLEAAEGVDTFVVCDNDEVAQWARERGAMVVRQHSAGLNGAVANGVDTATYKREWVLIAHSDLPFPEALLSVIDLDLVTTTVTIVPDRHLDGTNVLVVPARCGVTFHYGPGSFSAHQAEAERIGLPVRVIQHEQLGLDIDTPEDLAQLPASWLEGDFS
ncbi:MAG: 2-phospho-L-lactate guanylyltransferase [Actinomycetota bacterium]